MLLLIILFFSLTGYLLCPPHTDYTVSIFCPVLELKMQPQGCSSVIHMISKRDFCFILFIYFFCLDMAQCYHYLNSFLICKLFDHNERSTLPINIQEFVYRMFRGINRVKTGFSSLFEAWTLRRKMLEKQFLSLVYEHFFSRISNCTTDTCKFLHHW